MVERHIVQCPVDYLRGCLGDEQLVPGPPATSLVTGDSFHVVTGQATDSRRECTATSSTVTFTYATNSPHRQHHLPGKYHHRTRDELEPGAIKRDRISDFAAGSSISTTVNVSVQQGGGSSSCWTGSGNTYTASCPNYVTATSGTTNWSLTDLASNLTSEDIYSVTAQATDSAGTMGTSTTIVFTYNTAPPTVTVSYPSTNTAYGDRLDRVRSPGTAASNSGTGGIASAAVAIENYDQHHLVERHVVQRYISGLRRRLGHHKLGLPPGSFEPHDCRQLHSHRQSNGWGG